MALSIGIDLGTTNSVAAVATPTGVEFTLDADGRRIHPSVVAFPEDGGVLVGQAAREHRTIDPRHTVYSAKRLIGQNVRSPTVQLSLTALPYRVDEGPNQQPMVVIRDQQYTIPQISAEVLAYLRHAAQRQFGEDVREAVITVPANFTDAQRQATKEAGRLAGLEVLRLINEPTAAALAYGYGQQMDATLAVYDFGGGTFDISILQARDQVFEVLATEGELFLGGDDMDRALAEYLAEEFNRTQGIDLRPFPDALTRLIMAAEEIKCHLSEEPVVEGTIDDLPAGDWNNLVSMSFRITRKQLADLISGYVDQTIEVCRRTVIAAGLDYKDVNDVICVGGSTRVPLVRKRLGELFGRIPSIGINPDEVVAHGAAIQAGSLSGKITLGTGMAAKNVVSERRSQPKGQWPGIPGSGSDQPAGTTAQLDPLISSELDLDQAVPPRPLLLDVTPATLSVATAGGYVDRILDKNAPIPIERTKLFTTARNNQERVVIECCRGEETRFVDNENLGTLVLESIPPGPRGEVEIAVTFRVDSDGILTVRACDRRTGEEQSAHLNVLGAPVEGENAEVDLPSRQQP